MMIEDVHQTPGTLELAWALVAFLFFCTSLYMRAVSDRSYPRWCWGMYLFMSIVIVMGISVRGEFPVSVQYYLRFSLIVAMLIFGGGFYQLASAYADMKAIQEGEVPAGPRG